jgi:hypothetical protein
VSASSSALSATKGYAIMFPAIGVPILMSIAILWRFRNSLAAA